MWKAFVAASPDPAALPVTPPPAWHFCDNEGDANTCAALAKAGRKRATAASLWYFESRGERVPQAGDYSIVTNWDGVAQCVIRTVHVEVVPFDQVGEAHAAAEGEGDLTLEWWRSVHRAYYGRELEGTGYSPRPDMPIVCEYFERVYP